MKSRKTIEKSMKSRKTIEKSLRKAMEKGTWPIVPYGTVTGLIVPYGACHAVTGSVRGVRRGGKFAYTQYCASVDRQAPSLSTDRLAPSLSTSRA